MYNSKFILEDNQEVYPGYLDKEQRKLLKEKYSEKKRFMRCGCKPNEDLFYNISEDFKIYPEHKNYVHDIYCCRYKSASGEKERQVAYVINDEDGEVTAFVSFNPREFSISSNTEKEEDNPTIEDDETVLTEAIIEKQESSTTKEEKKEPKLALADLIRSINVDSYTEKVLNNHIIASRENFSKFVFHRMKKVRISRMKKKIGELSLENDGVRFIYLPFSSIVKREDNGLLKCYIQTVGPNGKVFNNFTFPETLEKAVKKFTKTYGIAPDQNTIVAGFQYYKKTRSKSLYKVLGRIHLFQVSNIGLYSRSLIEKDTYDRLTEIMSEDKNIKFWVPPEDQNIGGIIEINNKEKKILLLFRSKNNENVLFDTSIYVPLVVDEPAIITKEYLHQLI